MSNDSKQTDDLLLKAGLLAIAYFGIVKPVLAKFGIDPHDSDTVNSLASTDAINNPFDLGFGISQLNENFTNASWKLINLVNNDPAFIQSHVQYFKDNLGSDDVHNNYPYVLYAIAVNDAMGFFWIDDATVESVFSQLSCQYQVTQMAMYLNYAEQINLFDRLKNGQELVSFMQVGIGDARLAAIIDHIRTLPVFSPQMM